MLGGAFLGNEDKNFVPLQDNVKFTSYISLMDGKINIIHM